MDFDHYVKDFAYDFDHTEWSVLNCLKYLETHLQYTSDSKKDIIDAFVRTFETISKSTSMLVGTKKKAQKLASNVEETFQRKEIVDFFRNLDLRFETMQEERDLESSFDKNGRELLKRSGDFNKLILSSRYMERTKELLEKETTSKQNHNSQEEADIVNSQKIEDDHTNLNSNQSNDQIDYAEVDKIIVNEISCLILDSEFSLEEIWKRVMERLKEKNLRVQSIESRIVDLSNWSKVEWSRILKLPDYAQLFDRSKKKLHRDKIDKDVHGLLRGEIGQIRSLNNLESWIDKFSDLKSIDAKISVTMMKFFHQCLRREINVLTMQHRERDFVVKILGPVIGNLLEEFDIGTFELNWIEKESRSVTNRKRKDVHEEYVELTSDMKKIDLIISLRSHKTEILALEVGNTSGSIDDTKCRKDHSKLKIIMKDCLDSLWRKLHFKKMELEEVFPLGIQVTGTSWTIYSLSYDNSQNFYFFVEMATLILPTTLSEMEDLLPDFLENLLALRHTLIELVRKIRTIAQKRLNTPSPPSSPLHSTADSPPVKKQKKDPFWILDNLY